MQYNNYTAIEHKQDLVITRNQSDFKECKNPVLTPGEFLHSIEK
jgi:hypothetical protein